MTWLTDPATIWTWNEYVPGVAPEPMFAVSVLWPVPPDARLTGLGLKPHVTFAGRLRQVRLTCPLKPFSDVRYAVLVGVVPGEPLRLNVDIAIPTSAVEVTASPMLNV
jgi:hypothetical protein